MTNTLTTIMISHFGSQEINVVQATGQPEPGVTRQQLGEMLGYSDPHRAISKIHERNANRLNPISVVVKMTGADGKSYDTTIYGFKGILEVCRHSNKPNANAVMDWAWETLDKLRKGEISTPSSAADTQTLTIDNIPIEIPLGVPFSVTRSSTGELTVLVNEAVEPKPKTEPVSEPKSSVHTELVPALPTVPAYKIDPNGARRYAAARVLLGDKKAYQLATAIIAVLYEVGDWMKTTNVIAEVAGNVFFVARNYALYYGILNDLIDREMVQRSGRSVRLHPKWKEISEEELYTDLVG